MIADELSVSHDLPVVLVIVVLLLGGLVWEIGDLVLETLGRIRKRRHSRPCPRCGRSVKTGLLDCPECGFDLRAVEDE